MIYVSHRITGPFAAVTCAGIWPEWTDYTHIQRLQVTACSTIFLLIYTGNFSTPRNTHQRAAPGNSLISQTSLTLQHMHIMQNALCTSCSPGRIDPAAVWVLLCHISTCQHLPYYALTSCSPSSPRRYISKPLYICTVLMDCSEQPLLLHEVQGIHKGRGIGPVSGAKLQACHHQSQHWFHKANAVLGKHKSWLVADFHGQGLLLLGVLYFGALTSALH